MNYNPESQRLYFDNLLNARDLGGMPLSCGSVFKEKILIRSASPSLSSNDAIEQLKDFGVKLVIDLRSELEVEHYGNPFREDISVEYMNISLFLGDPDSSSDPTMQFLRTHYLGDFYVILLEELADRVIKILRVISSMNDGIILFHCAHGKDRTGVIAALLYLLAGASRENIILNYKVSYDYAKVLLDPLIEEREAETKHTLRSDEINMKIFLDYIDNKYDGDITKYLLTHGMTIEEIYELKSKLIQ